MINMIARIIRIGRFRDCILLRYDDQGEIVNYLQKKNRQRNMTQEIEEEIEEDKPMS